MQALDLWLDYIETAETLPLFCQEPQPYDVATLASVDWNETSAITRRLVRDADLSVLAGPESIQYLAVTLDWLLQYDQKRLLIACYDFLLSNLGSDQDDLGTSSAQMGIMLDFLKDAPFLAVQFAGLDAWDSNTMAETAALTLQNRGSEVLDALIVSARAAGHLVVGPFQAALRNLDDLSLDRLAMLIELCALTIASPDLATDLLLTGLEPASQRLVGGDATIVDHFVRHAVAVALEHIAEAEEEQVARPDLLSMTVLDESMDGYPLAEVCFRIDATRAPENGAHVHLAVAQPADQLPGVPVSVDAVVVLSQHGTARFQCFHPLPPFASTCSWRLTHCGSFVTTKTMLAALRAFASGDEATCGLTRQLLGLPSINSPLPVTEPIRCTPKGDLNTSQRRAVDAALTDPLVCLWGPPGTGKTQTIVEMILVLQDAFPDERILVTAPTHNAVDNVMRRYLAMRKHSKEEPPALRVSTEVRGVPLPAFCPVLTPPRYAKWPKTCGRTRVTP